MLKLLVVEDHALVREGLVRLLAQLDAGAQVLDRPDFESAQELLDGEDEFDLERFSSIENLAKFLSEREA